MTRAERTADVVVIGGGVIGCAVAYQLARRGAAVTLVERDRLGVHSTGRNAGGVRTQFSAEANVRVQLLSMRLLEQFEDELGVSPGLKRIGYLFVLSNEADAAAFRGYLARWRELGVEDVGWVTPGEIGRLAPLIRGDDVVGGTFGASDGLASPADITYGYAGGARRLGAEVIEECEVVGIDVRDGRVERVRTTRGAIACGDVFVCAGAWSRRVGELASVTIPVDPYPRQIFVTGPVAGLAPDAPMTIDFATSFYFHPEGEGALLGMSDAASEPSFSTETDWGFLDAIGTVMRRRAPAFLDAEVRTGWAGLYEVTPDNQPILGRVAELDGLWCACGFSGHGFMQAPAVGVLLAQAFAGEEPAISLEPFAHGRFGGGALDRERAVV